MQNKPTLGIQINEESQLRLLEFRYYDMFASLIERNITHLNPWFGWMEQARLHDGKQVRLRDVIHGLLLSQLQSFIHSSGIPLGIWYQDELVGCIWLTTSAHSVGMLKYWLDAEWQGKGLMTLAVRTLITYAFQEYHLCKIEIHCAVENVRSRAIPERLGFQQEGILRQQEWLIDHFADNVIYGMLESEWQAA